MTVFGMILCITVRDKVIPKTIHLCKLTLVSPGERRRACRSAHASLREAAAVILAKDMHGPPGISDCMKYVPG